MKKILFFLSFILLSAGLFAQEYELYRCSEIGTRTKTTYSWTEWTFTEVDMLIRICLNESKIEFDNKAETTFYISYEYSSTKGIDNDGDKYTKKTWSGYDNNGKRCHLVSIDYPNLISRNFILEYSDAELFFATDIIK